MHPTREAIADVGLEFTGVLAHDGEARHKVIDSTGTTVPVLVLDLESETGMHMPLHVEQLFPSGQMQQAQIAAKRYRKGQRVTVQAPALTARLAVTASHIHQHKNDQTRPCPDSPSSP